MGAIRETGRDHKFYLLFSHSAKGRWKGKEHPVRVMVGHQERLLPEEAETQGLEKRADNTVRVMAGAGEKLLFEQVRYTPAGTGPARTGRFPFRCPAAFLLLPDIPVKDIVLQ